MNKIEINKLGEFVYHEILDNGINVYIYPTNNTNEYFISFFTKYGSVYNDFKLKEDNEFKEYPKGIAHFLEHKLFESEDESVFDYFAKNGSYCNAYTSFYITNYIVSGKDNYFGDLNYLINYVQKPHITNENVEKEKGIIEQELNMYMDDPYYALTETTKFNLVTNHSVRYDIGGKVEDIKRITKDMLDDCYNTFYSPNNMNIVVSGNIDVEETISKIKENQYGKHIDNKDYTLMKYIENNMVSKKEEIINMDVEVPLLSVGLKLFRPINIEKNIFDFYVSSIIYENFNKISDFYLSNLKEKNLFSPIGIMVESLEDFVIVILIIESNNPELMKERIIEKYKNMNISESFFERFKKKELSNLIYYFEDHKDVNDFIVGSIIDYGYLKNDIVDEIKSLKYNEFNQVYRDLQFDIINSVIIKKG